MKKALFPSIAVIALTIFLLRIIRWFVHFSDSMNRILDIAMFGFIGLVFVVMGFVFDNKLSKIVMIACGLFLIVMNFVEKNDLLNIIGIICLIAPILIARFSKENTEKTRAWKP